MTSILLQASRLALRDFQSADLEAVHAYAKDERVVAHQEWGPNSLEQTRSFVESCAAEPSHLTRRSFNLAVVLADGRLIGGCLASLDAEGHAAEIGYSFNPRYWGQGYASEAVQCLLQFLWRDIGLRRVSAYCRPENAASIALLQRASFRLEGQLREHKLIRGHYRDSLVWGRLAGDGVLEDTAALSKFA
ncbi:GNAT family N-acetyltransferase [Iodobacter arcticus]|uniref:GNAT family N-acetyltransferase n=1 Tax=Iodobacter arcticus TaxID=590593 RepID=A0ABW2R2E0_9NEIS